MKKFLTLILIFSAFTAFSQVKPGKQPDVKSDKPEPIYMVPTGSVNDTLLVYAVVVSLNQPLSLQGYQLITKSFIYEDKTKKPAEQYLEKVIDGIATPVKNWRARTLFIVERDKLDE